MKRLELAPMEVRTPRDMNIFHSHPRTRIRAQAMVWLSPGLTLLQVANEFAVHLNSVEHWRQRWNKYGLTGCAKGIIPEVCRNGMKRNSKHCVTWPTSRTAPRSTAASYWAERAVAIRERL